MPLQFRRVDIPALVASAAIGVYGLYLAVVGPILSIVTPDGAATSSREPNLAGLVLVGAGVLVWFGIVKHTDALAWTGAALAAMFSVLFLFSVGLIVMPFAAILLLALAIRRGKPLAASGDDAAQAASSSLASGANRGLVER